MTLPSTAWQPGKSPNPSGKAKNPEIIRKLERMALGGAFKAMAQIIRLANESEDETIRLKACMCILDRAMGKPVSSVELKGAAELTITLNYIDSSQRLAYKNELPEAIDVTPSPEPWKEPATNALREQNRIEDSPTSYGGKLRTP